MPLHALEDFEDPKVVAASHRRKRRRSEAELQVVEGVLPNTDGYYSRIAEEGLISAIMNAPHLLPKVLGKVKFEDFYRPETRACFEAIEELYSNDRTLTEIDVITLREQLKLMGKYGTGEGQVTRSYLVEVKEVPESTPQHAVKYANIVKQYALRRKGSDLAQVFSQNFMNPRQTPEEVMKQLVLKARELDMWFSGAGFGDDAFMPHEESARYFEELDGGAVEVRDIWDDTVSEVQPAEKMLPIFGIKALDGDPEWGTEPLTMIDYSTVTTILADTNGGKSVLADMIAEENAKQGLHVLFCINELSIEQMKDRRMARLSKVPIGRIRQHRRKHNVLSEDEKRRIREKSREIVTWPGTVDYVNAAGWGGDDIWNYAQGKNEIKKLTCGEGYSIIVVDYLQSMGINKIAARSANRSDHIASNMQSLSNIASTMNLAVVVLSQVTAPQNHDKTQRIKPGLHSGDGSSFIQKKSNNLYGVTLNEQKTAATFQILKATFGETGKEVELAFKGSEYRFY